MNRWNSRLRPTSAATRKAKTTGDDKEKRKQRSPGYSIIHEGSETSPFPVKAEELEEFCRTGVWSGVSIAGLFTIGGIIFDDLVFVATSSSLKKISFQADMQD
ncbi:hypothetical protein Bca4012_010642 [Brassica carinata]|uniref:Uncharacterized protein n=1 Tax=Brassica carinata TaxID=52824 RepID=A0A8X7S3M8_BRACI|nr:hypothetical protein Bca52824_035554 [Brassica carinata]